MNLKYGHIWPKSNVLGPGRRYIIWTQGCFRRCFRCASPELQPIEQGFTIDIETLAQQIINFYDIDGITISGGEPFLQAKELGNLLSRILRVRPELNVILFTGYKFEDLSKEYDKFVLNFVDVLIDGEYIDGLNDNKGLRGSSNQVIHFLSSRLLPYKELLEEGKRKRELHVINETQLLTIGIADKI